MQLVGSGIINLASLVGEMVKGLGADKCLKRKTHKV
jgi:hypothetical protein